MIRILGTKLIEYIPAIGLLVLTILYLATASGYEYEAREAPVAVGCVMLVLLLLDLVSRTSTPIGHALLKFLNPSAEEATEERFPVSKQLSAMLWVAAYTAMLFFVGVLIATPLYVFGSMRFHGKRTYSTAALAAVLVTLFTWALFEVALRVTLYPGLLFAEY